MALQIKIAGALLMVLSLAHIAFPRYFNWEEELKQLSLINKQLMIVHTFFIALAVFLMGLLCMTSAAELVETKLGKSVSFGFGVFWVVRLVIQFFGYSSDLWKGKLFETIIHILFSCLWLYLSVLFLINFLT
jgi:hypothetical protein